MNAARQLLKGYCCMHHMHRYPTFSYLNCPVAPTRPQFFTRWTPCESSAGYHGTRRAVPGTLHLSHHLVELVAVAGLVNHAHSADVTVVVIVVVFLLIFFAVFLVIVFIILFILSPSALRRVTMQSCTAAHRAVGNHSISFARLFFDLVIHNLFRFSK